MATLIDKNSQQMGLNIFQIKEPGNEKFSDAAFKHNQNKSNNRRSRNYEK